MGKSQNIKLERPFTLTFNSSLLDQSVAVCIVRDSVFNRWSHEHCATNEVDNTTVNCVCSMLGSVTVVNDVDYLYLNPPGAAPYRLPKEYLIVYFVLATMVYLIFMVVGLVRDFNDYRQFRDVIGTSTNGNFKSLIKVRRGSVHNTLTFNLS
jgi:hypothetical protein